MTHAGLMRRLGSLAYELLLLTALIFVAGFVLLPLASPGAHGDKGTLSIPDLPARVMLFCALFMLSAAYFVWSWSDGRRTLPMKTWRLRIVAVVHGPPTRKAALARYLAAWIGPALALAAYVVLRPAQLGNWALCVVPLNFLWALADRDGQFLHDRVAGTRIIDDRPRGA